MTDTPFKAKPYTGQQGDTRWRVVDVTTGEILDDAQGYGYKTAPKAYAGFGYKQKHKNLKKANRAQKRLRAAISQWEDQHQQFANDLTADIFSASKDGSFSRHEIDRDIEAAFTTYVNQLPATDRPNFSAADYRKYR